MADIANIDIGNIFSKLPGEIPEEIFEEISMTDNFRIERIVSDGHSSPKGFWYDQDTDEWVMLIRGSAGLMFEGHEGIVVLKPGDYVRIPAHTRHRVEWTDSGQKTIWLAIHYRNIPKTDIRETSI